MAATVQVQIATGATATYANAETGIVFNREDTLAGTTPIPIPTSTGTNYSWIKNLCLSVTATSTTTISNRAIAMASTPTTGLTMDFKSLAVASYAQAAAGNMPAAAGANGAVPSTYTAMTTANQIWDATSVSTGSTGVNGNLVVCVMGVDFSYTGGAGASIVAPTLNFSYNEQ